MAIKHIRTGGSILPRSGVAAVMMMTILSTSATAAIIDASMFSYAGFGTAGLVHSDQKNSDYIRNIRKPNGAGHTRAWSPAVDSDLGLQLMFNRNDLSAVVQVISEQRWNGSYKPEVEWANIQYAFTPNFSARVGRIVLPTYMLTESAKVGYANTMVRVPLDAYSDVPISNNDGIDATYRFSYEKINNSTTVHYGATKVKGLSGLNNEAKKVVGIANNTEYGPYKLHIGYTQFNLFVPTVAVVPIPSIAALAKADAKVMSIGLAYDADNWFASAELTTLNHVIPGKKRGWYLLGGYRIHEFTPYLSYSSLKQVSAPSPVFARNEQNTVAVGVRWDFYKNVDMKLQFEQIRTGSNSKGAFLSYPGNQPGTTTNLLSATVDFVF